MTTHTTSIPADSGDGDQAAIDAVLATLDGHVVRESNHVADWPEDEQELYRSPGWRSFQERADALSRLRARKLVDAVLSAAAGGPDMDASSSSVAQAAAEVIRDFIVEEVGFDAGALMAVQAESLASQLEAAGLLRTA